MFSAISNLLLLLRLNSLIKFFNALLDKLLLRWVKMVDQCKQFAHMHQFFIFNIRPSHSRTFVLTIMYVFVILNNCTNFTNKVISCLLKCCKIAWRNLLYVALFVVIVITIKTILTILPIKIHIFLVSAQKSNICINSILSLLFSNNILL